MSHESYLHRCLEIASLGINKVAPNPMVGAILVHNEIIIGEGYHQFFGGAHAEVNCIQSVKEENKKFIRDSTLYISLEPCTHFGKTPPCVDLILSSNIPNVIISSYDCNEKVREKGVKILRDAGVNVVIGILDKEQQELNKRFYTFYEKKRPYILLKWAESQDGYIGIEGKNIKITNLLQDISVHARRAAEQAIMVGTNTVRTDNPKLDIRYWSGKPPIRVVIDKKLEFKGDLNLFKSNTPLIVFNEQKSSIENNIRYVKLEKFTVEEYVQKLYSFDIISVMIEGGAVLLQSFINAKLYDEILVVKGSEKLNYGIKAPVV